MNAEKLFALGRAYLREKAPYIATTVYGLVPEAVKGCGTMAVTSSLVLYYDPDWIENETEFQTWEKDSRGRSAKFTGHECIAACIHHECQHVLRGLERLAALPDKKLANIAADMAINYNLREADWRLPSWVVYPETCGFPGGKTLEEYYRLLSRDKEKSLGAIQKVIQESGVGQRMRGGSPAKGQHKEQQEQEKVPSGEDGEETEIDTAPFAGQCGGIAGNAKNDDLEKELNEQSGRSPSDVNRIQRVSKACIQEYLKHSGRGSASGFTLQDLQFTPKKSIVDWRRILNRVVRRTISATIAGGHDFSLRRPSKRSMVLGVIRPGLIDHLCEVAFIRDTSGSMSNEDLNNASNEAIAVMKQLGLDTVWFINADVGVHSCQRMRIKDIPTAKAIGRGGTDFRPSLTRAAKLRPKPDVVIYLTDGDGQAPEKKPSAFEVVWCIVPSSHVRQPAAWGRVVLCSNDEGVHSNWSRNNP